MGRLRFILLSGLLLVLFVSLGLIATIFLIDAADFVSDWSPAEQAQRLTEMSLFAAVLITPLALILFAKGLATLGRSGWWFLPIYGLLLGGFLIEWISSNDPRSVWAWVPFAAVFVALLFGDLMKRNADA